MLGVVRNEMRLRVALREGKKREVRRMFWAVGHKVLRLKRLSYGPIRLARLPEGKWRKLTDAELAALPREKSSTQRREDTKQGPRPKKAPTRRRFKEKN